MLAFLPWRPTEPEMLGTEAVEGAGPNGISTSMKWATAHPIRSARDLARFLSPQTPY
jgi:hypothetical protein